MTNYINIKNLNQRLLNQILSLNEKYAPLKDRIEYNCEEDKLLQLYLDEFNKELIKLRSVIYDLKTRKKF